MISIIVKVSVKKLNHLYHTGTIRGSSQIKLTQELGLELLK